MDNYVITSDKTVVKLVSNVCFNNSRPRNMYIKYIEILICCNLVLTQCRLIKRSPMTDHNRWMRSYNGNQDKLKVFFQNIPGKMSTLDKQSCVDQVLRVKKPDVLGIVEPESHELLANWNDYTLVKGTINGQGKMRINVLIRNTIAHVTERWNQDIPTCVLLIGKLRLVFVYREWSMGSDMSTRSLEDQVGRWERFCTKWSGVGGNFDTIVVGDCNFDFWTAETPHQVRLQPLRDIVHDKIISRGWAQKIRDKTRYQKSQTPSCLDHLYCRLGSPVSNVSNDDVISYDHHCIGFHYSLGIRLDNPVYVERRDIAGIVENEFIYYFLATIHEVYLEPDINEALSRFCHKVIYALDMTAPVMIIKIKNKNHAEWMTTELRLMMTMRSNLRSGG